jgi:hypothetical protein
MTEKAERRPGQSGVQEMHTGSGTKGIVTHPAEPPVGLARAVAELLELSGERDQWAQRLGAEYRLGYAIGHAIGVEEGRRLEAADRDRAWNAVARPIARGGDTHAELERRRWGPGGRERFGNPRPGDFKGRREGAA